MYQTVRYHSCVWSLAIEAGWVTVSVGVDGFATLYKPR